MKFKKILIGIDDSKIADNAAQYGFELAHQYEAEVALVHTVQPTSITPMNDTSMIGPFVPSFSAGSEEVELNHLEEEYSKKLLDAATDKYAKGLLVTQYNEFGSTGESIIECAAQFKADLIVIGTHSRTGLDRFLMGSVAEYVVRHSPVAVLVVPMKEGE
jgi:nucleotide-binding universal stress UspA family protein